MENTVFVIFLPLLDVVVVVGSVAEDVVVEEGEFVVVAVVADIDVADVVVEAFNSSSLSSKICRASFLSTISLTKSVIVFAASSATI